LETCGLRPNWLALGCSIAIALTIGCGGSGAKDDAVRGGSGGGIGATLPDGGSPLDATDAIGAMDASAGVSSDVALGAVCHGDDACTGFTPHCDLILGRCVACASNTLCPGGSVCDPATGACVECVTSDDCSAPTATCDSTRHICVATCRAGAGGGCSGGTFCDTASGSCLACIRDSNCSGGQHCDRTRGECVDCLIDTDCPADSPVCTPGHSCSDACTINSDCQDGPAVPGSLSVCDPSSHLCADCLRNADCGADSFCRPDGTCG
jgi:hypothetical protein